MPPIRRRSIHRSQCSIMHSSNTPSYKEDIYCIVTSEQRPQVMHLRLRLQLYLIDGHTLGDLNEHKSRCEIDVDKAEIRDDSRHAWSTSQREFALFQNLRPSFLVDVCYGDYDIGLLRVQDKIHGTAEVFDFAREHLEISKS